MLHRRDHLGMLSHAEIIVGTPDGDLLATVFGVARRLRELAGLTLEIGKNTVAAFLMQAVQRMIEKGFEIHIAPRSIQSKYSMSRREPLFSLNAEPHPRQPGALRAKTP